MDRDEARESERLRRNGLSLYSGDVLGSVRFSAAFASLLASALEAASLTLVRVKASPDSTFGWTTDSNQSFMPSADSSTNIMVSPFPLDEVVQLAEQTRR